MRSPFPRVVLVLAATLVAAAAAVAQRPVDARELDRIVELLRIRPGAVVADVGAGDGRFAIALAERVGPTGRVTATEIPDAAERLRRNVERAGRPNLGVVVGSEHDAGLAARCCDGILLRRVFHHFTDPHAMSASLARALRPGGRLLVVDFEPVSGWRAPEGVPASRGGHGVAREEVVRHLEAAGLRLVEERDWDGRDYALVFEAPSEAP